MSSSIAVNLKKRGRPATGKDPLVAARMPPPLIAALDSWIASQADPKPSRSEAIRRLLQEALAAKDLPES
jgi:Arc/MetJ-type ribon-helix-helix transcriptional regulator